MGSFGGAGERAQSNNTTQRQNLTLTYRLYYLDGNMAVCLPLYYLYRKFYQPRQQTQALALAQQAPARA